MNKKLLIFFVVVAVVGCVLMAQPVLDPVKPVLKGEPWAWEMCGKVIAWYQRVTLPDGKNHIIKIKPKTELEKMPKIEAWQAIVDKIDLTPEPEPPEDCLGCHDKCGKAT